MKRYIVKFKKGDEVMLDQVMQSSDIEDCFEKKDGDEMQDWEICIRNVTIIIYK